MREDFSSQVPWRACDRVAIVAAHPDDEVIGAGGQFASLDRPVFVHVTDGAPNNMSGALAAGFQTRQDYARARREEFLAALEIAGIADCEKREIGLVDQESSFHLAPLAKSLADIFCDGNIDTVLTHPYEGGHPDHDSTAFAVGAACQLLERNGPVPKLVEFTSYYEVNGDMAVCDFLPNAAARRLCIVRLSRGTRDLKVRMLRCYSTQQRMLLGFPAGVEKFRERPAYDFAQPPHSGRLFYERFHWGVSGEGWRSLAAKAAEELGLGALLPFT